ncbi:MAG: NADPH-dependent FMN reductase [Pseudomonadota bacterium]
MATPRIAVIVGSNRVESINRRLAGALMRLGEDAARFELVPIDDLPLYNFDLEQAWPAAARRFSAAIVRTDGVLIVTPEHNRSLPAVLKNAIDWGSRGATPGVWYDKPIAITGAARGGIGTAMVQQHLRQILGNLGAAVMGGEAYVGGFTPDLVSDDGFISAEATRAFLQGYLDRFAEFVTRLSRQVAGVAG